MQHKVKVLRAQWVIMTYSSHWFGNAHKSVPFVQQLTDIPGTLGPRPQSCYSSMAGLPESLPQPGPPMTHHQRRAPWVSSGPLHQWRWRGSVCWGKSEEGGCLWGGGEGAMFNVRGIKTCSC